jgi:hypothetical protein
VSGLSPAELEARLTALEADSRAASREFAVEGGLAAPSRANLVIASLK